MFECSDDLKALTRYRANSGEPWVRLVLNDWASADKMFGYLDRVGSSLLWGREWVEDGRFKLGKMTELDRQATLNALTENEIAKVEAIEENEDGTFLLALEGQEISALMGNYFADYGPLVATIREPSNFLFKANDYLLFATVKADGELADKFREMVESDWSYSTYVDEFDDREGTLTI